MAEPNSETEQHQEVVKPLLPVSIRRQVIFWLLSLIVFLILLIVLRSVLLPFLAGMALAYFLDPVADKLEEMGASRALATSLILLVFLFIFIIGLLLIVPVLSNQFAGLVQRLPGYVASLQSLIANSDLLQRVIGEDGTHVRENLDSVKEQGAGWLSTLLSSIWNSGKALVDVLALLVITPIVGL